MHRNSSLLAINYIPKLSKKEYTQGGFEINKILTQAQKNVKEENSLNCSDWAEYWFFVLFRECWRRKNTRGESENGLNCSDWADYQLFEIFQNVEKGIQGGDLKMVWTVQIGQSIGSLYYSENVEEEKTRGDLKMVWTVHIGQTCGV